MQTPFSKPDERALQHWRAIAGSHQQELQRLHHRMNCLLSDMANVGRSCSGEAAAGFESPSWSQTDPSEQCGGSGARTSRFQPDIAEYLAEQCGLCGANPNHGVVSVTAWCDCCGVDTTTKNLCGEQYLPRSLTSRSSGVQHGSGCKDETRCPAPNPPGGPLDDSPGLDPERDVTVRQRDLAIRHGLVETSLPFAAVGHSQRM